MKTLLQKLLAVSLFLVFLYGCAGMPVPSDYTAPAAATAPAAIEAPAAAQPQAGVQPQMTKCEWLEANVPQGNDGIDLQNFAANLLGVPVDRIRVHLYPCGDGKMVYDGFIVLGPREGNWTTLVTAQVPVGGAIDSYNEATYSVTPATIGQNTKRAVSGTVTATTMTYWFWFDGAPPVSGGTSSTESSSTTGAIDPTVLATQHGWSYSGVPDVYGGLVVTLTSADTLPPYWEAMTQGSSIKETDVDRTMSPGTWTVYPPYADRAALGYSQ